MPASPAARPRLTGNRFFAPPRVAPSINSPTGIILLLMQVVGALMTLGLMYWMLLMVVAILTNKPLS